MVCEGCGQNNDMLWRAGEDSEGRKVLICDECIREPSHRHTTIGGAEYHV